MMFNSPLLIKILAGQDYNGQNTHTDLFLNAVYLSNIFGLGSSIEIITNVLRS